MPCPDFSKAAAPRSKIAGPHLGRAAILIAVLFGSVEQMHGRGGQGEVIAAVRSETQSLLIERRCSNLTRRPAIPPRTK